METEVAEAKEAKEPEEKRLPVPPGHYSEDDLASRRRVSVKRLRNIFSEEGEHPPYIGHGPDKVFPCGPADQWLDRQMKKSKRRR